MTYRFEILQIKMEVPTYTQYYAMPEEEQMWWRCIVCCNPALCGSFQVGRLCSTSCAYLKYD